MVRNLQKKSPHTRIRDSVNIVNKLGGFLFNQLSLFFFLYDPIELRDIANYSATYTAIVPETYIHVGTINICRMDKQK